MILKKASPISATIRFMLLSVISFTLLISCAQTQRTDMSKYYEYINSFTGGCIKNTSTIRVSLAKDVPAVDLSSEIPGNPIEFSPSLSGKAFWVNNNTIEFIPDKNALKPGQLYKATFKLGKYLEDVPSELKNFEFSFKVNELGCNVELEPLTIINKNTAEINGSITFTDNADLNASKLTSLITVDGSGGAKYTAELKENGTANSYSFKIRNIKRENSSSTVDIKLNAKSLGLKRDIVESVKIPAASLFTLLSAERLTGDKNGIVAVFSSVLKDQNFSGLVQIPEIQSFVTEVDNNKLYIYFDNSYNNTPFTLNTFSGIKDVDGAALNEDKSISFSSILIKPQVKISSDAFILPDAENLILPFKAVNLFAVDLSIIKIYENNVLSFLQDNQLSGFAEIRKYGRLVYKKRLVLDTEYSAKLAKWSDYSIDMSNLFTQEPGAIYRVVLSFNQEYSAYEAGLSNKAISFSNDSDFDLGNGVSADDDAKWDISYGYYYYSGGMDYDYSKYNYEERDDPTKPTYYMDADKAAYCNVIASNIGVIVKRNLSNRVWAAVTDILTTKPLSGADVKVYNYQLHQIGEAKTDKDGFVDIKAANKPFVVVAEYNNQKSFVKVNDGEEQSVSRFNVGGTVSEKGLKGFIYGERGVWRPGDTLNISFMLEDRENAIPDNHPVSMELFSSTGQFYKKMVSASGVNGLYTFVIPTEQEVPTGLWSMYIKVGGSTFYKGLRIETIKPNRLKINLDLPDVVYSTEKRNSVLLSSEWLTGANASNLSAKATLSLSKSYTQFNGYKDYTFNDIATNFSNVENEVFNGYLNSNGEAYVNLGLSDISSAPGMLDAKVITNVFEPGGNSNINVSTFKFSPYSSYVGLNVNAPNDRFFDLNKEHKFDIVTLNEKGKGVSRQNIDIKIYKLEWSWWWDSGNESFSSYVNNRSIRPLYSSSINTVGGKGVYKFKPTGQGRYLVYVKDTDSGHATGTVVYAGDPYYNDYSEDSNNSGIKMLSFSFDKDEYKIGDKATIKIPKSANGRALISFEDGSSVLRQEWIDVGNDGESKYSFEVTEEMAPNIYIHISLLQPHSQKFNDLPIRMYGVMPMKVVNDKSVLYPEIDMPEVIRPEQEFVVKVSEKNGSPMTYTLAVVDDGLLDITNFKTPSPWNYFYSKVALGVSTWDMYDDVIGTLPGSFASLFSVGGDEQLKPSDAKANRFKPVVKFMGPFTIKGRGGNTHKITLPMYVGSVRTMVVAKNDYAYGSADKNSYVRMPLMLLSTMPRVLSVNEEILLPVNIFAMEKGVDNVNVSVECTDDKAVVVGSSQQTVSFDEPGDKLVYFRLKTGSSIGKTEIKINAVSGSHKTYENIEIDVRNPNPVVTFSELHNIKGNSQAVIPYSISGSTSPDSYVNFEFMRMPDVKISSMYDYLMSYSHSCTEQLVSKALPLLFINRFKDLNESEVSTTETNINMAIQNLYSRQAANGGFVYWPGDGYVSDWVSSYAGMFLVLAKENGYPVNSGVLSNWEKYQSNAAKSWKKSAKSNTTMEFFETAYMQAFRLYTLALAGSPDNGAMNRLKEMKDQLLPQVNWMLAGAYAVNGKKQVAEEIVFNAPVAVKDYYSGRLYGSSVRDEAIILNTLVQLDKRDKALALVKSIADKISSDRYMTTQSAAFSLMALSSFAEKTDGDFNVEWSINGNKQPKISSKKVSFESQMPLHPQSGEVTVNNKGKDIFVNVVTKVQLLNDTLPSASNNIALNVSYYDMKNNPISVSNINQGTEFKAVITVRNTGYSYYENLALTQIVPAGWEIITNNMNVSQNDVNSGYSFRDIRDDRVCTYFSLGVGSTKTFTVLLQAAYVGDFILPSVVCEEMYDPTVFARVKGGRTLVNR